MRLLTVGLTPHRQEFLPPSWELMKGHKAIILEEPPDPYFSKVVKGEISIHAYLEKIEAGFPEYTRRNLEFLSKLYQKGKILCQVEPYLERWLIIREMLDSGVPRVEVQNIPDLAEVYQAEHETFGKLLDYYAAMQGPFDTLVEKIKAFAQADAKRITLRDKMRAQEIISLLHRLPEDMSVYVEAGYIHLKLVYFLAKEKGKLFRLKVENLLLKALKTRGFNGVLPSPGDGLTSYYLFGGKHRNISEDLLAARSIVYIKLIEKEELAPTPEEPFPHLKNELFWRLFVWLLSYEDCKVLDKFIRLLPTPKAREMAKKLFPEAHKKAASLADKAAL
ncbi:hypothetical protein [Thermodesulfatator autotrophicus]|uniref:Uncharacterized protein n=1 Tax=Thermodesulfatator autotrophicus TaxID=1795632 RepID=A0A177EAC2_9BACT|nr:hypothetical protein [Thermodesulfatator autotrophicus]OAG28748.1 hypothetical protein TH606_00350 [Thermodesulfatator autotrophicus]